MPAGSRAFPATGAGPRQSSIEQIGFPAYSPGLGSYSHAGLRLFYSAGNPTWRIDPMSFTVIEKYHCVASVATGLLHIDARRKGPSIRKRSLRKGFPAPSRAQGSRAGFRKSARLRQRLRAVRGQANGSAVLHLRWLPAIARRVRRFAWRRRQAIRLPHAQPPSRFGIGHVRSRQERRQRNLCKEGSGLWANTAHPRFARCH